MELHYQALLEKWLKIGWTLLAVVSITAAYALEDQSIAWKACAVAGLATTVIAVPEWPIYKRHSVVFRGIVVPNKEDEKKSN